MPAPIRAHVDAEQPVRDVAPGIRMRVRIGSEHGAESLTVIDRWLDPGTAIPLHRHPDGIEEATWVVEGEAEFTVGDERAVVGVDHTVIVPAGTPHAIRQHGEGTLHILTRHSSSRPEMLGDGIELGALEA